MSIMLSSHEELLIKGLIEKEENNDLLIDNIYKSVEENNMGNFILINNNKKLDEILNISELINYLIEKENINFLNIVFNMFGYSINLLDKYNRTPLIFAIQQENYNIIKWLLDNKADSNLENPIYYVLTPQVLKLLLNYDCDLNKSNLILHYICSNKILCRENKMIIVKILLENEIKYDLFDDKELLAIDYLIDNKEFEIIDYFFENNFICDSMIKSFIGFPNYLRHLLKSGLNPNYSFTINKISFNIINYTINLASKNYDNFNKYFSSVKILIEYNCDLNISSGSFYWFPIHWAFMSNFNLFDFNKQLIKYIITFGADINAIDNIGKNILYYVNNISDFKWLISNGANVKIITPSYWSLMHEYSYNQNYEIVDYLLSIGSSYLLQDENGNIPLHIASFHGNKSICKLLLINMSDPLVCNKLNETYLDVIDPDIEFEIHEFISNL